MGRRGKPERIEALVEEWQACIQAGAWGYDASAGGLRRLADAIGIANAVLSRLQRAQLRAAAKVLPRQLSGTERLPLSDQDQVALRRWIMTYLVNGGADLLIPEEMRRQRLARLRDADRRRRHAERGLHAATVELPSDAWRQLAVVTKLLRAPSQGAALTHIIRDFLTRVHKQEKRRRSSFEPRVDNYGGLALDL